MSQFPLINLPVKHIQAFVANPVNIVPLPGGDMLLNFAGQPFITKLDAKLTIAWETNIQGQHPDFANNKLSASPDGRLIAIVGKTGIQILDASATHVLHTIGHPAWDRFPGAACYFSSDNSTSWYILPGDENKNDTVQVLHTTTFEVIASYPLLDSQQHAYIFHTTPDKDIILLEAIAGQDESILMQLQLKGNSISLAELTQCDGIMGNFAPSGNEFVMAPYYDGPLKIYAFPEITLAAAVEQDMIFQGSKDYPALEPDNINYTVFFTDDSTILLLSQFGRLLLLDRKQLHGKAEVMPEGILFTAHDPEGHPATNPDETFDYSSNIIHVMTIHDQLLLTTSSGELRTYVLPH